MPMIAGPLGMSWPLEWGDGAADRSDGGAHLGAAA
jgi:hypothetical protein